MAAVPLARAVTRPAESTMATAGLALDQATGTPGMTRPVWSCTSAISRTVSPSAASEMPSGVSFTTVGARRTTRRFVRPVTPDEVAEIRVRPRPTPVARPLPSTVAVEGLLDAQENSLSAMACPLASAALAVKRSVSPCTTVSAAADTAMVLTLCATVTSAAPATASARASIAAVPLSHAVTSPAESTRATAGSAVDQTTGTPDMTRPIWSCTSPIRRTVSPIAASVMLSGITATAVGTRRLTKRFVRPVTPDEVTRISVRPGDTPAASPSPSTVATAGLLEVHEYSEPATAYPFASVASAVNRSVSP